jgi:hypothetical protein
MLLIGDNWPLDQLKSVALTFHMKPRKQRFIVRLPFREQTPSKYAAEPTQIKERGYSVEQKSASFFEKDAQRNQTPVRFGTCRSGNDQAGRCSFDAPRSTLGRNKLDRFTDTPFLCQSVKGPRVVKSLLRLMFALGCPRNPRMIATTSAWRASRRSRGRELPEFVPDRNPSL